jgi:ABC-type branched-subunit amino acid transport system substrate-binding protein
MNRALGLLITTLAVVFMAGAFACSSESEPEDEEPTPTSLPALTGADLMQLTDDTKPATSSQDSTASRKGSLVIGNLVDTSGPMAEFGDAYRKAAELAAQHITEAGGAPVTIVHRDTGSDPTMGVAAARELVQTENVAAIVGARSGDVTIAVAESVTVPEEILLISPSTTSVALTGLEDKDFVFRTVVSNTGQGTVLATVATGEDHETAGVLHINDPYGQGLADQFTEVFEILGGKVTGRASHDGGQESYSAELRQAIAEDPDVLVAIGYPEQAEVYLSELVQIGYTGKLLLADAAKSSEMVKAVGGDALEGTLGTNFGSRENRSLKAFNTAYWDAFSEVPAAPFLAQTYDTVVLIALAAAKAGTIDDSKAIRNALREVATGPGTEVTGEPEGIKEALKLISDGKDIDYEGVTGSMEFNENGDVNGTIEIWKIEGGQIVSTGRFEFPYVPARSKGGGAIAW